MPTAILSPEQEQNLCQDYVAGQNYATLQNKYGVSTTQFYRVLKKYKVSAKSTLVDFGPDDLFKTRYTTLSKGELELLYGTAFANIAAKASRLGIKRTKDLIVYKRKKLEISDELIVKMYTEDKLSSQEIARRCAVQSGHHIRDILHKHGVSVRGPSETSRDYKLDETFFETIDTEAKAYFLGWLGH